VKGKVLLADGKPLTTGRVAFVQTEKALEFSGDIKSDGSFSLGSSDQPGAPEGSYKVRIDPEPGKSLPGKGRQPKRSTYPFPEKYADETTSGLTATVKQGENAIEPFKLVPGSSGAANKSSRGKDKDDSDRD
jgi:hypothetical protein